MWSVQLGKRFHLPVTATAMGQDVLPSNKWLKKTEIRQLPKIVTLSPFHQQQLLQHTGLTSEMIPWGLPSDKAVNEEKTIDLIGVGNLIPLKDYACFLAICSHLKKMIPDFKAVIVGTGPEKEKLQDQIRDFELEKNVLLAGQKSYEETQELIRSSKVLLHPSQFESFGMVIIEALATGTMVFARSTGIAESEDAVQKLSGDVLSDSEQIAVSLKKTGSSEIKNYSIQTTLDAYLKTVL